MHPSLEAYLDHLRLVGRSPLTVRRYGDVLRELDGFMAGAAPGTIGRDELFRFAAASRTDGRPRAPAGMNLRVAVLKAAFSYLHDEGLLPLNPAARLVGMKEPRRPTKYLTTAEVGRLLRHIAGRPSPNHVHDLVMVLVFWQTGLRVAELARLRWVQLDGERRALRDVLVKGGHVLDVALNDEALEVLQILRAQRHDPDDARAIFARWDGEPLSVRAIEAAFERWRAELGWTRALSPHVMRHAHATGELGEGVPIDVVAASLRHSGTRTVSVYAITQDRALRAGLAKLGALVPRDILEEIQALRSNDNAPTERPCVEEPFYEPGEAA